MATKPNIQVAFLILLLHFPAAYRGEAYTSSTKVKLFFQVDIAASNAVGQIVSQSPELEELLEISGILEEVTSPLCDAPCDSEVEVFHPINQFLILRKFNKVWSKFAKLMRSTAVARNGSEAAALTGVLRDLETFAVSDLDYSRTRLAIVRLQDMYNLTAAQIQQGDIAGREAARSLTAEEVLELGEATRDIGDRCRTKQFANLHASMVGRGQLNVPMRFQPEHRIEGLCEEESCIVGMKGQCSRGEDLKAHVEYRNLCVHPDMYTRHTGSCYLSSPHPIFVLSPLQVEEISPVNKARLVHNALTDADIATLERNTPDAGRATTIPIQDARLEVRVGTVAWLGDVTEDVASVTEKAAIIANRDASTSDSWQIGNYGIGGHYNLHHDFFPEDFPPGNPVLDEFGNRMTTFMAYLEDVAEGGNTVFPHLRLSVKPKKGTAVIWENLHPDGQGNTWSLHGGCPVLIGNKKIANKWFHYYGQFRKVPCNLTPDL